MCDLSNYSDHPFARAVILLLAAIIFLGLPIIWLVYAVSAMTNQDPCINEMQHWNNTLIGNCDCTTGMINCHESHHAVSIGFGIILLSLGISGLIICGCKYWPITRSDTE